MYNLSYKTSCQAALLLCSLIASTSSLASSEPMRTPPIPCVASAPITMTSVCGEMNNGFTQTFPNSIIACSSPGIMGYRPAACPNNPNIAKQAKIAGTVVFANNASLPRGTITTITLQNNSLADVAAPIIGKTVIRGAQSFPINFTIPYKTNLINSALLEQPISYGVHVRIEKQGKLLFISDTFTPAFSGGAVNIPVVRVQ